MIGHTKQTSRQIKRDYYFICTDRYRENFSIFIKMRTLYQRLLGNINNYSMLEKTYKYKTIYLYLYNKCIYHDVCIRIMNSKPVNNLLCQPYTPLDMSDMLLATCIFEICIPTCFIQ